MRTSPVLDDPIYRIQEIFERNSRMEIASYHVCSKWLRLPHFKKCGVVWGSHAVRLTDFIEFCSGPKSLGMVHLLSSPGVATLAHPTFAHPDSCSQTFAHKIIAHPTFSHPIYTHTRIAHCTTSSLDICSPDICSPDNYSLRHLLTILSCGKCDSCSLRQMLTIQL